MRDQEFDSWKHSGSDKDQEGNQCLIRDIHFLCLRLLCYSKDYKSPKNNFYSNYTIRYLPKGIMKLPNF